MADVFVEAKLVVVDNCLINNRHHVSLLKEDLAKFCKDHRLHTGASGADELTFYMWKATDLRSTPVEGGILLAANILRNLTDFITPETSHTSINSTVHSSLDAKFMTIFCSPHLCSAFGFSDKERVVFRLCANVPVIERVVLGAETDEAFRWASGESFRTELRDIICRQILLCTVGCSFGIHLSCFSSHGQTQLWKQLCVIDCIPVCQGRLTEASEIVVKCHKQHGNMPGQCRHICKNCHISHGDNDSKAAMVSDFAIDIVKNCSSLASSELKKLQQTVTAHELNFMILTDVNKMTFITFQQSPNIPDIFSVAVFSRHCAFRLGIMTGNVVELLCKSHGHQQHDSAVKCSETGQHACRKKVVIACVNTACNSDDVEVCISSCVWFNMCSISCMSLSGNCDVQPCCVKVSESVYVSCSVCTVQVCNCRVCLEITCH